ncbi:MAG: GNAT family N-acetyltransferase [Vicinamibacteria bacterium]
MKSFESHPLTPHRWNDFETLFGAKGACGGCWCMFPRLKRSEYEHLKGEGNRRAMKKLVDSGRVPGILGYVEAKPVAWCSIEPRGLIGSLARSRILAPVPSVNDEPVWSIVCLFLSKSHRGHGLSTQMIEAAVRYAKSQGASIVEAYPVEPRKTPMPAVFAYPGIASAYLAAGFQEVARRSETRPIMRRWVSSSIRARRGRSASD